MSRPFRAVPNKQRYPRALPWAGMSDPVGVGAQDKVERGTRRRQPRQGPHGAVYALLETCTPAAGRRAA
jgi:hypothetical protein